MSRRHVLAAPAALAALLAAAATAQAAPGLAVAPANAAPTSALTVTWTPAKAVPAGARVTATTLADTGCTSSRSAVVRGAAPAGRAIQVRLRPGPRWCVRRLLRIAVSRAGVTLAATRVRVGTPVQVRVLSGTLTTSVPGRPDRVATVTGQLRGGIPGPHFRLDRDITSSVDISELRLAGPPADAFCPAADASPRLLPVAPGGSMTLKPSGAVVATIRLLTQPATLSGCPGGADGLTVTTIRVTAPAGSGTLRRLAVTGTVAAFPLADGASATVTLAATVSVDLGGSAG